MRKVFDSFFPWVWAAVSLILASGFWMMFAFYGGEPPLSQWIMAVVGCLMAAIFSYIYLAPNRRMGAALEAKELAHAAAAMGLIRRLIGTNLNLGLLVSVVAVVGKFNGF